MLTGGQVAGLIVAMFWAILVCLLAVVLVRLARLITETTKMVSDIADQAGPLLDDMAKTVEQAGEQLDRVDGITRNMAGVTQNLSAVTTVVTSLVGGPLVKAAAFSHGVRRALGRRPQPTRQQPVSRAPRNRELTAGRVVPKQRRASRAGRK